MWHRQVLLLTTASLLLLGWGLAMQVTPTIRHLAIADGLSQNSLVPRFAADFSVLLRDETELNLSRHYRRQVQERFGLW
jgi:hypothetical protein